MSVSYLSKPIQSSPYVLPIDLQLFQNVMSVKQKQFDINHDKIQSEIDQMGMLDVIKDEDKNYVNSKIQNLVSSINSFGGVDLSDSATVSQVEGLGRDIYGDDKVINAVSSTKSIRNLVQSYQNYKTNPKLTKLYSPGNEWYDMRAVNDYVNDGQIGSTYHGPSTASPYNPYKENLMKALDKVKTDEQVILKDNGLYWSKKSQKFITPQRIYQMASDLLTPDESVQLHKDGIYQYSVVSPLPPDELIRRGVNEFYNAIDEQKQLLKTYRDQETASIGDPNLKEQYTKLGDEAEKQLTLLQTNQKDAVNQSIKAYKENPEGYMGQVYKQDFLRGLANRFSVNQTDVSIIPNQAQMFKDRMDQAERFHKDDMDIEEKKLAIQQYGAVYKKIDLITGKTQYLPLPYNQQGLSPILPDITDPDKLKVNEDKLREINTQLQMEADASITNWMGELSKVRPDLFEGLTQTQNSTQSETGVVNHIKGTELLESYNGKPGFQLEDLGALSDGTGKFDKGPTLPGQYKTYKEGLVEAGWNDKQIQFLKDVFSYYQGITDGKADSTPNLPPGTISTITNYALKQQRIEANISKLESIKDSIFKQAGLTPEEIKVVNDYTSNPDRHAYSGFKSFWQNSLSPFTGEEYNKQSNLAERFSEVNNKIKSKTGKEFRDLQNEYLQKIPTRDLYGGKMFSADDEHIGEVSTYLQVQLATKKGEPFGDSKSVSSDEVTKITPLMTVKMPDGSGGYGILASIDSKDSDGAGSKSTYLFPIDGKAANALGIFDDPYEDLNYIVNIKGRSNDLPAYGSKDLAVNVIIQKTPVNSLNGANYQAYAKYYYLDDNGNRTGKYELYPIPGTEAPVASVSYQQAVDGIKKIASFKPTPLNYNEFKKQLQNYFSEQTNNQ